MKLGVLVDLLAECGIWFWKFCWFTLISARLSWVVVLILACFGDFGLLVLVSLYFWVTSKQILLEILFGFWFVWIGFDVVSVYVLLTQVGIWCLCFGVADWFVLICFFDVLDGWNCLVMVVTVIYYFVFFWMDFWIVGWFLIMVLSVCWCCLFGVGFWLWFICFVCLGMGLVLWWIRGLLVSDLLYLWWFWFVVWFMFVSCYLV